MDKKKAPARWQPGDPGPPPKRKRENVPARFRIPESMTNPAATAGIEAPEALAPIVAWAARELVSHLEMIASGSPLVPARGTSRRPKVLRNTISELRPIEYDPKREALTLTTLGTGTRRLLPEDAIAVLRAYQAWAGIAPEKAWKQFLAEELQDAHVIEGLAPHIHGGARRIHCREFAPTDVTPPRPPAGHEILGRLVARCPPGSVPKWLDARVIEAGLEMTTDAPRGGGRGPEAKMSAKRWVEMAERTHAEARRKSPRRRRRHR